MSFDNVSGTTVNNDGSGGSAMNGTLNGGASITNGGRFGNALYVTGTASSDASVRIANAVVPLNVTAGNPWTVACWIKSTTMGGTWMYQGGGGWGVGNTTFAMLINNGSTGNNGHAAGGVRNSSGWLQGTTPVDDGNWHHIVVTWDGTTKIQYVDGVVDTWVANQWGGSTGTGGQFWIGGGGTGEGDGQVCLNGLIDEAYVYNIALSPANVAALYASNSIPTVPVAVTLTPNTGYGGQVFTVTATATPANGGVVTSAVANLSALGLSASTNLFQQSANVWTNTFTIPTNVVGRVGADNVTVTMIDTEPLAGIGGNVFTVLARPPTNAAVVTQLTSKTNYAYTEVSFLFKATNDAPIDASWPMNYYWYTNSVLVRTNPMGPWFTFLTTPDQNNMTVQCIATVANTNYSYIAITSAPVTLVVNAGTPVYTNGLKLEVFSGVTSRNNVEIGNVPPGVITATSTTETGSGGGIFGDNTSRRYSGYFIPPTTDNYVFFLASDDDCDLFLSTDGNPGNKYLIAQETVWSNPDQWHTSGGNSNLGQKRSDQWTNSASGSVVAPYAAGIPLNAGQAYYIECVEHNGTGGDGVGFTYETMTELTADSTQPVDGSLSRMTAANNNIAVVTWPGTVLNWKKTITPASYTLIEGGNATFSAVATNDAEMIVAYQWYVDGSPIVGATGTNLVMASVPFSNNGSQVTVVAYNYEGGLAITSAPATLHVSQAAHESGYIKDERWDSPSGGPNWSVNSILNGSVPTVPNWQMAITEWGISTDNAGGHNNFVRRVSGYFTPPSDNFYNFYVTSDDDSQLFLSTDDTPGHKVLIASQGGWNSGGYRWATANGGGVANQTHSDTFLPAGSNTPPNSGGILLYAGSRYYIEQDMHQGGGGANLGATWTYFGDPIPAQSSQSQLKGSYIQMNVARCSYVAFTTQPQNVANAPLGSMVAFSASGTTDSSTAVGGPRGYEEVWANNKLLFQWFTNGVAAPGANSALFLMGPVTSDMVGMQVMCQTRALGFTDDSLNPIWTNSTSASITSVTGARPPELVGHWFNGTASLADSANVDGVGNHDAVPNLVSNPTNVFYLFTNDVPPSAPNGAVSVYMLNDGFNITNTDTFDDNGYKLDTFDGGLQKGATVMCWAKGFPGAWNPWVSKYGENGFGWQLRINNAGPNSCWTMRGTGNNDDMTSSIGTGDGKWHHYAGTWNGTNFVRVLYVDGVQTATATGTSTYAQAPTSQLMIGARDAGNANYGNYFTGLIYDVRIYNYPLSQGEVINIAGVKPVFPAGALQFSIGPNGPQIVATWPTGSLQSSTNVSGPFTPVAGATSPYTNILSSGVPNMFFRLSQP